MPTFNPITKYNQPDEVNTCAENYLQTNVLCHKNECQKSSMWRYKLLMKTLQPFLLVCLLDCKESRRKCPLLNRTNKETNIQQVFINATFFFKFAPFYA